MTHPDSARFTRALCPVSLAIFAAGVPLSADPENSKESETKPGPTVNLAELVVEAESDEAKPIPKAATAATKLASPLMETPQSISVVTRAEIDMRGAQSVEQAASYTPGVLPGVGGEDSRVDDLTIRGFDASGFSSNVYLDGLRVPAGGQWTRTQFDIFGLESIEILKGPSAVLYGQVAPGGLLNLVSKRPTQTARHSTSTRYGSFDTWEITGDSSGPLDSGGRFRYRVAGLYRGGDSQIEHTDLNRFFLAPSLTWDIGDETSLTLLSSYQKDRGGATYQFLPVLGTLDRAPLGRVERETFIGEPDHNTFNRDQYTIGYEFTHRFSDQISLQQNLRYGDVETLYDTVVAGRTAPTPAGDMSRRAVRGVGDAHNLAVDTRLQIDASTGPVKHTLLAGFDYLRASWHHDRTGTNNVPAINIFNPIYTGISSAFTPQVGQDVEEHQDGVYLQDQLEWGQWRLMLGARYDESEIDAQNTINGVRTRTDEEAFTWRAGLLYGFDSGLAPYISYATSFDPVSGSGADGRAFDPSEGAQYEMGIKFEPRQLNALFTLSAFQLTQKNVLTLDPTDPLFQAQTGEVELRGVELEAKIALAERFFMIGGWTALDSEITRNNDGNEGNDLASAPRQMGSLWLDYTIARSALDGLGIGAGIRYVDSRFGDHSNTYMLPSYTLFDAALRYDLGKLRNSLDGLRVSLTASNLADKTFVAKAETLSSANYGPGRTVYLNLSYQW